MSQTQLGQLKGGTKEKEPTGPDEQSRRSPTISVFMSILSNQTLFCPRILSKGTRLEVGNSWTKQGLHPLRLSIHVQVETLISDSKRQ